LKKDFELEGGLGRQYEEVLRLAGMEELKRRRTVETEEMGGSGPSTCRARAKGERASTNSVEKDLAKRE